MRKLFRRSTKSFNQFYIVSLGRRSTKGRRMMIKRGNKLDKEASNFINYMNIIYLILEFMRYDQEM